jgi:trans-aconitate methyltransferase
MTNFISKQYWNNRYLSGGNSGAGSYSHLAKYKSVFLTDFIEANNIKYYLEYGAGDCNNLKITSDYNPDLQIVGLDVSEKAIEMCKEKLPQHKFFLVDEFEGKIPEEGSLVTSLDVIYHLIEDEIYEDYMKRLTDFDAQYIIIYSPDFDNDKYAEHVKARKFSDNEILTNKYKLMLHHPNDYSSREYEDGSFADWFIYKRKTI